MPIYDSKVEPLYTFLDTGLSIVRVLMESSFTHTRQIKKEQENCLILGNGPSLLSFLEENNTNMNKFDIVGVNYMAISQEYIKYQPGVYVLCDPAFWFSTESKDTISKVKLMFEKMVKLTTWSLQLYMPYQARKQSDILETLSKNSNIKLCFYNKTKYEGWGKNWVYKKQLGMPRAQNVLNAALMLAIYAKYSKIFLAGADNDWISNLWVDENNNVRINDTHFYDYEEAKKNARYFEMSIDESMLCFYFAFHTYKSIKNFAARQGVQIFNANPHSYIDVFEKQTIII